MDSQSADQAIIKRRIGVFALSVIIAGISLSWFCSMPLLHPLGSAASLFPDPLQEGFFFDLFGSIGGCWLLCFIGALCSWRMVAKLGQWLGIFFVSVDQMILVAQWRSMSSYQNFFSDGLWIVPAILQVYFVGLYFGFFTLPALTLSGNRSLTGLGTLVIILPWLLGRGAIIMGTRLLP